jgi:hypothetical protein
VELWTLERFILIKEMMSIGLVIRNLGTQFTSYSGTREKYLGNYVWRFTGIRDVPIRWHLTFKKFAVLNLAFRIPTGHRLNLNRCWRKKDISD